MTKLTHLPAQPFADGVYKMALGPAELYELEHGPRAVRIPIGDGGGTVEVTPMRANFGAPKRGVYEVFASIMSGRIEANGTTIGNAFQSTASVDDITTIVRLGLIGGGMKADEARALVASNGPPHRPLNELWEIAAALVYAVLCGIDETVDG